MLEKKTVFTVATFHCDSRGRMQPHALMHQVQEIASRHAEELGVGYDWMERNGYYWVLVNFRMEFLSIPRYSDTVMIRTWPSGLDLLRAFRDFKGTDLSGNALFRATSDWMVIDSKRMRPVMIKDLDLDFEYAEERLIRDPERLLPAGDFRDTCKIDVPYSSIDMNGHVNNTEYVRWGVDAMRKVVGEDPNIKDLQITFLAEVFKGDELVVQTHGSGDGPVRIRGKRTRDKKDVFVMDISLA